ncbi:hypothetical protein [Accumulibacter sp.]|uniref:hypothetical protein n=1 Tax=Accumulibacter sp. TaxID=2053492 RepID=UPI00262159F8|nr:hypothetical protein [Accumulibacter sp.]
MSLDKAIRSGREHRKSYEKRGKPGRFAASCRPHGGGHKYPCPWCQRARLLHALREAIAVREQLREWR